MKMGVAINRIVAALVAVAAFSSLQVDAAKMTAPVQQIVSPSTGCIIKEVIVPNTTESGLDLVRHGGDPLTLVDTDATSFSCVDARTEHPIVGAFGGDTGEFLLGLDTYRRLCTKTNLTDSDVLKLVTEFVEEHTTEQRPFYMHTDNTSLAALLTAMNADSFPTDMPDAATKKKWFDKLLQGTTRYHGCGHLWYQIAYPAEYDADVNMTYSFLRAFFELFWTPEYADRIHYELVLGAMNAHAVAIIEMETSSKKLRGGKDQCIDQVVPLRPRFCPNGCPAFNVRDFKKSKNYSVGPEYDVFTFHESAVERHRKKVAVPFFMGHCKKPKVTAAAFYKLMVETAERWAEASLHHLNALPNQKPHLKLVIELEND